MDLFVREKLGDRFVEPPPFDLDVSFNESSVDQPLVFVLSPGSDPTNDLYAYAQKKGVEVAPVSLGQGQGPIAENIIKNALGTGRWVVLQNCHLMPSWMPTLLRIVEEFNPDTIDGNFRLWLTSYPSPKFPVPILQNGVKMTNEPPKGMRANMYRSFSSELSDPEVYGALDPEGEDDAKGKFMARAFKKAAFALCFFHGMIQERRQFGPLGWNVPYEFNQSDLHISMQQLAIYVQEAGGDYAPWPALNYVCGECNYGGRVTDAKDRVTLVAILGAFFCDDVLQANHSLSESGNWRTPDADDALSYEEYVEYIQALPTAQMPETFGFHANADIAKDEREARGFLLTAMTAKTGGGGGGGGSFDNKIIDEIAKDFVSKLPGDFKPAIMQEKFPVDYNECLNTVLIQEAVR